MPFKLGDWIKHPRLAHGQIIEDCDSSYVARFVTQGGRNITKELRITRGNPPHPQFTFPEAKSIKRSRPKGMAKEQMCFTCAEAIPFIQEVMKRLYVAVVCAL